MTARKLSALFDVEPGEGRPVVLLLTCSFFLGSSITLASTAAYALFVSQFGAQGLPYVYMVASLVITASSFTYLRLSERLSFSRLLTVTVSFVFLVLAGLRLGLTLTAALWLTFSLPICAELADLLTNIAFWNLVGRLFNVRQGKRLFGLIGGGRDLAKAAGGFVIPVLVLWIGTPNLLLTAAVGMACALGLIVGIVRSYTASLDTLTGEKAPAAGKPPPSAWWKNRYVLLILGLFAFSMVMWCTLDIVFYGQANQHFAGEDRLAGFLGLFYGIVGLLNLLGRGFFTAPLLKRYGVRGGLLLTPLVLLANGFLVVLVATTFGASAAFFWLVAVMTLLVEVFSSSVDTPVLNILYQPLPASQRLKTQALVEGLIYSLSIGLSGVGLWALGTLWRFGPVPLSYVVLMLVIAWAGTAVLLGREYPHRLRQALERRRLGAAPQAPIDGSTQAILLRQLQSPSPGVVSYALTMLEGMGRELVAPCLPALLDHPAQEVRQDVLERIERLGVVDAAAAVRRRLALEPSPAVRGTALRTLSALAGAQAFEWLSPYLQHPASEIRCGALVGLLRHGGLEGVLVAENRLLEMASSAQPAERALAAQVLGEAGAESFCQRLVPLLRDEDPQVQRAALWAAGRVKSARLWPLVADGLFSYKLRRAAISALASGGDAALPALFACLADAETLPRALRELVSVCGRVGGARAIAWLKARLAYPDAGVRTQVLHALCRCGYQALAGEVPQVVAQLKAEVAFSARMLAVQADIGERGAAELLQSALGQMLAETRARIFFLLSFLYDRQSVLQARYNLSLASADRRAYALEVLDVLLSLDLKKLVLPLLSELPAGQTGQQMRTPFPQAPVSYQERLAEIIANRSGHFCAWAQACALYAAGRSPATAPAETVAGAAAVAEPLVRETALWALSKLEESRSGRRNGQFQRRSSLQAGSTAHGVATHGNGERSMLTTVEKVIALKRSEVFVEVPDEILAELARCLEEVEYGAGQVIFSKGDLGDCMYIVADGRVRIHDGDRDLDDLRSGEVLGEMALLDAEPRSASATAREDSLLLRLDQEPLYEAMEDRIEVAHGIIRMLSRRLRARLSDLSQLAPQAER